MNDKTLHKTCEEHHTNDIPRANTGNNTNYTSHKECRKRKSRREDGTPYRKTTDRIIYTNYGDYLVNETTRDFIKQHRAWRNDDPIGFELELIERFGIKREHSQSNMIDPDNLGELFANGTNEKCSFSYGTERNFAFKITKDVWQDSEKFCFFLDDVVHKIVYDIMDYDATTADELLRKFYGAD